jgi:hypothetical protein
LEYSEGREKRLLAFKVTKPSRAGIEEMVSSTRNSVLNS